MEREVMAKRVKKRQRNINWDKWPLGEKSDRSIARRLRCNPVRVWRARIKRAIPAAIGVGGRDGTGADWKKQPLGKMSDADVARKLGCAESTVFRHRHLLGIAPFGGYRNRSGVDWDNEVRLGKISDRKLAKELGLSPQTVLRHRNRLGIPPFGRHRLSVIDWDNEVRLGKIPDTALAKALGCSPQSVGKARARRGIQAHSRGRPRTRDITTGKQVRIDWDKEPLGELPDGTLALMIGSSQTSVYRARVERDIPACGRRRKKTLWLNE